MLWRFVVSVLLLRFSLGVPSFYGVNNGYVPSKAASASPVILTSQWQYFYFTNTGSVAFPQFLLPANATPAEVRITDLFCAGDIFNYNITSLLLNTTGTTSIPEGSPSCSNYTTDPEVASNDLNLRWSSSALAFLAPLDYLFTIYPISSPFTAGAGAIRLGPVET